MAKAKKKAKKPAKTPATSAPPKTRIEDISPDEQIVGAPLLGKVREFDPARMTLELLLEEPLSAGDNVRIKGAQTDLSQRVERLRVGGKSVQSALAGETVELEVADRVRVGDAAYKVRIA